MRFSIAVTVCLLIVADWVGAASGPLLKVDFESPVWTEVLTSYSGRHQGVVQDGTAMLKAGKSLMTQDFAYYPGEQLTVCVKARCQGVKAGKARWKVGRVVVVGYNSMRKSVCHYDVLTIRGDQEWETFSRTYRFNDAVKYFRVFLRNEGSAGCVWYDELELNVANSQIEMLTGDAGFEGSLGVDHWYFQKQGDEWDSLQVWQKGSTVKAVGGGVAGGRAVKFQGPATLVSKAFAYHGEELRIGGWMRSRNLQKGTFNWCGAGVQLVGFDEKGRHVCHTDLNIMYDNTRWTHFACPARFSNAVKKVQVWIRVFEGARGLAWFDEVYLERIPLAGQRRPFDAAKARITIDASKPTSVINHRVWAGIDLSYCDWLLSPEVRQVLPKMCQAGFELMRVHEVVNGMKIYSRDDKNGKPVYDWSRFDECFDLLVKKHHITPIVTLESTPDALAREGTKKGGPCNRYPPADFEKWGRFVEAIFEHAIDRYGKDNVQQWFWEIWNEPSPNLDGYYYKGTAEDFLSLSEPIYLAVERVEKRHHIDLQMGLTSSGSRELNELILNRLKKLGKLGLIDHYSQHFYVGARMPMCLLTEEIPLMRKYRDEHPGMKDYLIGCTEWNSNSMNNPYVDRPWNASMAVKAVVFMLNSGLDYATYFTLINHPYIAKKKPQFCGYLGLFTCEGIPKPTYNAFVFLNELKGGKRIALTSSNDPIDGLAVVMPDGTIRIVLTNFDEDTTSQPYNTRVTLAIKGVDQAREYTCVRHWQADQQHGNTYGKWVSLGRPDGNDLKLLKQIKEEITQVALPLPAVAEKGDQLVVNLELSSPGICFLELK